jgi:hypothetical protein
MLTTAELGASACLLEKEHHELHAPCLGISLYAMVWFESTLLTDKSSVCVPSCKLRFRATHESRDLLIGEIVDSFWLDVDIGAVDVYDRQLLRLTRLRVVSGFILQQM